MRAPWRIIRLLDQGDRAGLQAAVQGQATDHSEVPVHRKAVEVKLNMGFFLRGKFRAGLDKSI